MVPLQEDTSLSGGCDEVLLCICIWLNNLGNLFGTQFEGTGSIDDLNRAVEVTDMGMNSISEDHPDRAGWLNNLGNWLGRRF